MLFAEMVHNSGGGEPQELGPWEAARWEAELGPAGGLGSVVRGGFSGSGGSCAVSGGGSNSSGRILQSSSQSQRSHHKF